MIDALGAGEVWDSVETRNLGYHMSYLILSHYNTPYRCGRQWGCLVRCQITHIYRVPNVRQDPCAAESEGGEDEALVGTIGESALVDAFNR